MGRRASSRSRSPHEIGVGVSCPNPLGLPGDYNNDGRVSNADYSIWRTNFGLNPSNALQGDGNGD